MNSNQLNNYFSINTTNLIKFARNVSNKYNRKIDPNSTLSECYIYVYDIFIIDFNKVKFNYCDIIIKSLIDYRNDISKLESYVINWINKNAGVWGNTKLNRLEGNYNDKMIEMEVLPELEDSFDDYDEKIELEIWYQNKKSMIYLYRQQEEDRIKQIIFDCYFIKEKRTGIALGKHLYIKKDYARIYINKMKEDIINFEISYNNNNNNNNKQR